MHRNNPDNPGWIELYFNADSVAGYIYGTSGSDVEFRATKPTDTDDRGSIIFDLATPAIIFGSSGTIGLMANDDLLQLASGALTVNGTIGSGAITCTALDAGAGLIQTTGDINTPFLKIAQRDNNNGLRVEQFGSSAVRLEVYVSSNGSGNFEHTSGNVLFTAKSATKGVFFRGTTTGPIVFNDQTAGESRFGEGGGNVTILSDSAKFLLGAGRDASIYYDNTNLIIDPDEVGSGIVLIGETGDDDMKLNTIEIDGDLNHDGAGVGFYGTAPIAQAVLATGAGATVDNVITALQNLGLVKQA